MPRQNLHEYHGKTHEAKGKILLMDDDRFFSLIASVMLHDIGYSVVVANDGLEAISIYREQMEKGNTFDAVILDIFVKNSMGAGETIAKLLEIDPAAKTVVSSVSHSDPLMKHYETFGFKAALPKPYSSTDVWNAISKAINS